MNKQTKPFVGWKQSDKTELLIASTHIYTYHNVGIMYNEHCSCLIFDIAFNDELVIACALQIISTAQFNELQSNKTKIREKEREREKS